MDRRALRSLLLVALLYPGLVQAQTSAGHSPLAVLAHADSDTAGSQPDERALLRGVRALQIADSTATRDDFDAAVHLVAGVIDRHPDWPDAWYQLGRIRLAMHRAGLVAKPGPYQPIGSDYLQTARTAFTRALDADSTFLPAGIELAATATETKKLDIAHSVVARLERVARAHPDAGLLTSLGVLERVAGDDSASATALRQARALGADSSLIAIELARTLFQLGDTAAAERSYYAGLADVPSAIPRAQYRIDLAWIATPAELAAFDSVPADSLDAWVHRFWNERDVREGRLPGERLAEHYRRLDYALKNFRSVGHSQLAGNSPGAGIRAISGMRIIGPNGETKESKALHDLDRTALEVMGATPHQVYAMLSARTMLSAYRSNQQLVDDRGVIYIRYGEPDARALFNNPAVDANESWKYRTPTGPLIFHFVGLRAPTHLVEQLPLFAPLMGSRSGLDPRYSELELELSDEGAAVVPEVLQDDRERNRAAIAIGTTTDAFPIRFDHRLDASVETYGLGTAGGTGTHALVAFAVRAGSLPAPTAATMPAGMTAYPLHLRLIAEAGRTRQIFQQDTVRVFATHQALPPNAYLTGQATLPLPPGRYAVRVLLADPAGKTGVTLMRDSITVPNLAEAALTASDLVLGRPGSPQHFTLPDGSVVHLNPLGVWIPASQLTVYYQVGGMDPGRPYRTRFELRRRYAEHDEPVVAVQFSDRPSAPVQEFTRSIDLKRAPPGDYDLVMMVRDAEGTTVTRRQQLHISEK
ncbi:MAG TPA: GWxTD domain-containing protein [Gemmatimonadales bacterium]|nr:GWxTD domain-containing protein [Gemmatimonadales bacterium]